MFDHFSGPNGIKRWLRIAMSDLCEDVKPRLRDEIEEHFTAAVEDAMAQGRSREMAESDAIQALGSPYDARSSYNRKYLTRTELSLIRMLSLDAIWGDRNVTRKTVLLIAVLLLVGLLDQVMSSGWLHALSVLIRTLGEALILWLGIWVVYRLGVRWLGRSLRARLIVNGLAMMSAWLTGGICEYWLDPTPERPSPLLFIFIVVYWILVARPIRKLGDPRNEPHLSQKRPDGYA